MKKFLLITSFVFIFIKYNYAEKNHDGRQLFLYGSSAAALGRGATGVSYPGIDLFYLNPAAIAELERAGFSFNYGDLGKGYSDPAFTFALPTSYGIFGAYFRRLSISEGSEIDIQKGLQGGIGAAKQFTTNLSLGIIYNFLKTEDLNGVQYYNGGTFGLSYRIPVMFYSSSGLGIYEPRLGFSINAGFSSGEDREFADLRQITAGYNVDFFRNSTFTLGIFNDCSIKNNYQEHPVKFGVQSYIKNAFVLRAGGVYPGEYGYGGYTLGLGFRLNQNYFTTDLNYSFVHYEEKQFVHYLGLNFKYGELDREPPYTKIKPSQKFISPNYDGKQDYVIFDIDVSDHSKLKGWRLQIINSNNDVVRTYKVSDRDMESSMGPLLFISKIWQKKESAIVPEKILWDGGDANGKMAPDGIYRYSFLAWDERDNYSFKKEGKIFVDNSAPAVEIEFKEKLFSPNGDKNKDRFIIRQKFVTESNDNWKAGFKNSKGIIVRSYKWSAEKTPEILKWDGKDDKGNDLPEGLYHYYIESEDRAGNSESKTIKEISLFRKYELIDLTCGREYFSYKKNKIVQFRPLLSSQRGLKSWQIIIEDEDEDSVKIFKGGGNLPVEIEWNMQDDKNKNLSDGIYYYYLSAVYASGNAPHSYKKKLIIDSTPPEIDLDFYPGLFSPDGDGENDLLSIETETEDQFGIKNWSMIITNPTGYYFKGFSGSGAPGKLIKWDGLSDENELVESASEYSISLRVTDNAGNTALIDKKRLPIGVLVIVTERGLKIRINNIEFAFNSAGLNSKAKDILDRVVNILEKYQTYKIIVEGHTDDIGEENYNLNLSESRAKAVFEYLIDEGIDPERLTFRGLGETAPFVANTGKESRRKNRRVEFILIKQEKSEN